MSLYLIRTNDMIYECSCVKTLHNKVKVLNELGIDFDIYRCCTHLKDSYYGKVAPQFKDFIKLVEVK